MAPPAGKTLQGGRYCLLEQQGQQRWGKSAYEVWWLAQDRETADSRTICEMALPESGLTLQKTLQPAMRAMLSAGLHPSIVRLLDVFQEGGHVFFVFERPGGESLQSRIQRTRSVLAEHEVIACCLQITEIFHHLSQHSPPIVHGLISPDCIVATQLGPEPVWMLADFSLTVACGATQYLTRGDSSPSSPFSPPEGRGLFTTQTDMYSLMAVAYYAVTGLVPVRRGNILPARQINPAVSEHFSALLAKGLAPVAQARFHEPLELYWALEGSPALDQVASRRSVARNRAAHIVPRSTQSPSRPQPHSSSSVVVSQPRLEPQVPTDERSRLFPDPRKLLPLPGSNDGMLAAGWVLGTLLCETALLIAAR
jgi:serine/threonine protein kinase